MSAGIPFSNRSDLRWVRVDAAQLTHASAASAADVTLRWRPCREAKGLELVVTRGDITKVLADAIVSPTGSDLACDCGVSAAIVAAGGREIVDGCSAWIEEHGSLPVSYAMSTPSKKLPCFYVIHTVGPILTSSGSQPTSKHAKSLRAAVRSALREAARLGLTSIAMPGISCGNSGYPNSLATTEIVNECVRYVHKHATGTTLKAIVFMDSDESTSRQFALALHGVALASERSHTLAYADGLLTDFQDDDVKKFQPTYPPPSPPTLFEHLLPDDPEYQRILAELPPGRVSQVVGVRRVRVSTHHSAYEKTKKDLRGRLVREVEPLYHGTPNRWRATAIALAGFDLSIHIHGRSYGNGVYASPCAATAFGYTRGVGGSLVRLRGLVCHSTIADHHIYVFPNPAALLSLTIIDYEPEDEQDRKLVRGC